MAEPLVLSILTAKYARLKGEMEAHNAAGRRIARDMHHVECVIRLFREEFEGRKVKAVRPRKPARWTRSRDGLKLALDVLRKADQPMTSNEIAYQTAEIAGLPIPDKWELWAMSNAINTSLKRRIGKGIACDEGRPRRWALTPPAANTLPISG
jgi:hypothetical protein